jgi:catechol 2,3-dioxygenase-like lactoylglutathione lyase family enzyme
MPHGLDHIVHAVRNLDAAAALYRRLGFTVGTRNRHPWGTQNHVVQLPGFFVELLGTQGQERYMGEGFEAFFADVNARFLIRHEGLSFVMLESTSIDADAAAFRAAGIGISDVIRFERASTRADGRQVTVGFALAFARDSRAPWIGFAACQQQHPGNFWNAHAQRHPNSATAIAGIVLVAENPSDHHIFLSAFTGVRDLHASSSGVIAAIPRGDIRIMFPAAFEDHYKVAAPDIAEGMRLAALRFTVGGQAPLEQALTHGGIAFARQMDMAIVAPADAMGATLVFAQAPADAG